MPRLTQPRPNEPIKIIYLKSGEPRYQAIVDVGTSGDRHQSKRNFPTLKAARAFVDRTRTERREGTVQVRDGMTLRHLVDAWSNQKDDIRGVSLDGYTQVLKPILRDHGDVKVQSISRTDIDAWRLTWPTSGGLRRKGLSRRSIQLTIQALRLVFAYGIEIGVIRSNPAAGVRAPRESLADQRKAEKRKVTATVWSFDQLRKFVAEADNDELAAAMRLSACGLRRSEVLGLSWQSIDLDAGTVTVEQGRARDEVDEVKSEASERTINVERMLPGTVAALKALKTRQARQKLASGPGGWLTDLVVLSDLGLPYDRDSYSDRFRDVARRAELPPIHLHAIRHSIATELHNRGVAPATAAAMLGHSIEVHLKTYVQSTPVAQDAAAEAFGLAFLAGTQ